MRQIFDIKKHIVIPMLAETRGRREEESNRLRIFNLLCKNTKLRFKNISKLQFKKFYNYSRLLCLGITYY